MRGLAWWIMASQEGTANCVNPNLHDAFGGVGRGFNLGEELSQPIEPVGIARYTISRLARATENGGEFTE